MPYYHGHKVRNCFPQFTEYDGECASCPIKFQCQQAQEEGVTEYDLEYEAPFEEEEDPQLPANHLYQQMFKSQKHNSQLAMPRSQQMTQRRRGMSQLAPDESAGGRFIKNVTMGATRGLLKEAVDSVEEYRQYELIKPEDELTTRLCKVACAGASIEVLMELLKAANNYEIE